MRINGTLDTSLETVGNGIQVKLSMEMTEEPENTNRVAAFAAFVRVPAAPVMDLEIDFDDIPKLCVGAITQCAEPDYIDVCLPVMTIQARGVPLSYDIR
jgi:hypothetical protein